MKLPKGCWLYNLPGRVDYRSTWEWQKQLRTERIRRRSSSPPDVLILVEHRPVYTLGAGSDIRHVKFDLDNPPHAVHRVERGGEVTYHGPGQVVGYPILNLEHHKKDLRWYLWSLEEVIIRTVERYGINASRVEGRTGVWFEDRKIAAIGVAASRWVTMHGFSLNVLKELTAFDHIYPCGIADKGVGCLNDVVSQELTVDEVKRDVAQCFAEQFEVDLIPFEPGAAQAAAAEA